MLATVITPTQSSGGAGNYVREDVEAIKTTVDVRKLLPVSDGTRHMDGYDQRHCVFPDHADHTNSMLAFPDGVACQACGGRADAIDLYRMYNPDASFSDAITALLADPSIVFTGVAAKRELRGLDQDLAVRYHLALMEHPEALAGLEAMGFTREAIRHFQLGYTRLPVRQEGDDYAEFYRYSVPVFDAGGHLKQVVYRKAEQADLGPKTVMEKNAGGGWLFNDACLDGTSFAVLASGWGDVVALWQWGVPAVCSISGDGTFKDEWLDQLGHIRRFYIVPDADRAGAKLVARVQSKLPWARHVKLPFANGSKADVRDYHLAGHTRADFLQLLKLADMQSSWQVLKRGR